MARQTLSSMFSSIGAVRAIRIGLGTLLVVTAGMKFYAYNDPSPSWMAWYSNSVVRAVVIEWELLLGLWLLAGWSQAIVWWVARCTFGWMAVVSLALGVTGQPSCGCFGAVRTSPWVALVLDLVVLRMLLQWRPESATCQPEPVASGNRIVTAATFVLGVGLVLGMFAVGTSLFFGGSVGAALAFLRDEPLSVSPAQVDFGEAEEGQILETSVEVGNWTTHEVRVVGGTVDCSCDAAKSLPVTIPAGQTRSLCLRLHAPPAAGKRFGRFVELWTDSPEQPALRLPVTCMIRLPWVVRGRVISGILERRVP